MLPYKLQLNIVVRASLAEVFNYVSSVSNVISKTTTDFD